MTTSLRVGQGFDVHPFGGDGPLILGGVEIDGPGLAGHSDGDVVVHAVADALLGPTGLGDLGTLFPATDDRFRGADSLGLLRGVCERLAKAGWGLVNVDAVVVAQQPVLAPHLPAMVTNIAAAVDEIVVDEIHAVSLKAKFGEGVGALGRAEGVATWATALLARR